MYRILCMFMLALVVSILAVAQTAAPPAMSQEEREQMAARMAKLNAMPDTRGTGAFPAMKEVDAGLPDHVVYRPIDLSKVKKGKLGIFAWGNGGCSPDGASQRQYLLEVASHGYVVIAPGKILSGPGAPPRQQPSPGQPRQAQTTTEQVNAGIDWALAENARPGSAYYKRIDSAKIAVSGFSCGGLQALQLAGNPRVKAVVIHNSGVFPENNPMPVGGGTTVNKSILKTLHTPVIYIMGGPKDMAYANGMDDFKRIDHVPAIILNDDSGHGGAFNEPNGGAAAQVAVKWLEWQLRGDSKAKKVFVGKDCGVCADKRWTVERKNFPGGAQ
jgi:hypothetical protein